MEGEDGQAIDIDLQDFDTGPVDVDMIFKRISVHELPAEGDLNYISKEGESPKIYPERGELIHLASHPVDIFFSVPPNCNSLVSGKMKFAMHWFGSPWSADCYSMLDL